MLNFFRKRRIYLDYASAPPALKEASRAVREAEYAFGNPGAIHEESVAAKRILEDARTRIARILEVTSREIAFTSGLTESNNLAILGAARAIDLKGENLKGTHWIVSAIEHDSVLECFSEIERLGGIVSHALPNEEGIIKLDEVKRLLRKETVFVSVGWANNEIGVIQPLAKIAQAIRDHEKVHGTRIIFHTDAGQAPLYLSTTLHSLGVDMLSFGANKLYGPHGIGALFISNQALAEKKIAPTILGGAQEKGLRAGTENAALAQGFATAFEIIARERERESVRLRELRDTLARELTERVPGLAINGSLKHILPHMLNVSIPPKEDRTSEYLSLLLDRKGIALSTKSACNEGEQASHVVTELRGEEWRAKNTLRFSLGRDTTSGDIRHVIEALSAL